MADGTTQRLSPIKAALARIRGEAGVVGAGVLVLPDAVVTCAHVVAAALGTDARDGEAPAGSVQLDFPFVPSETALTGRVTAWFPVRDDASHMSSDIAVLALGDASPRGAQPCSLVELPDPWARKFRVFGFPAGFDSGQWASGLLRDSRADGWVQLEDIKQTGYFIAPGFSGTPVWDEDAEAVAGIVAVADSRADLRAAFMIPTDVLVRAHPPLHEAVRASQTSERSDVGAVVAVLETPETPDFDSVAEDEVDEAMGNWLISLVKEFFDTVQIAIDRGSSHGVSAGDYFAVLAPSESVRDLGGDLLGSVDRDEALIRVVSTQQLLSVCQLTDWAYQGYFERVTSEVSELADADGKIDVAGNAQLFWPVRRGQRVYAVPREEKAGRDEVQDLYDRTLDEHVSDDEKRFLYQEMIKRVEAFLLDHGTGYFASAMLFQRGYAQIKLGQNREAIATFEMFLSRYPFSVSAPGARNWIEEAEEALRAAPP